MSGVYSWAKSHAHLFCIMACVVCFNVAATARTLRVPSEYPTIQAALNNMQDGDVVELADGIYTGAGNKDLRFPRSGTLTEGYTLRSVSGDPNRCIIDCEGDGRGFEFDSVPGPDPLIEGITITNGFAPWGGGVYCHSSTAPKFINCIITNCRSEWSGGGVFADFNSYLRFEDCKITYNQSGSYYDGGGLYLRGGADLIACEVIGNVTTQRGGGLFSTERRLWLDNCVFRDNFAEDGGAFYFEKLPNHDRLSAILVNCTIMANVAQRGGAFFLEHASVALNACVIEANEAEYGGGIYEQSAYHSSLLNCLFLNNHASMEGGAAHGLRGEIRNSVFYGNSAGVKGGAIAEGATLLNSILWNNTPDQISRYADVSYSNVQGGWTGTGNIDVDPRFALGGDFYLAPDSPCIDAGLDDPPIQWPLFYWSSRYGDADRLPRPIDGNMDEIAATDMGIYEFDPNAQMLAVSATELSFSASSTGQFPTTQQFQIKLIGSGEMPWQIVGLPSWLSASPSSGVLADDTVTITLDAAYHAFIPRRELDTQFFVEAPSAQNVPQAIRVTLEITNEINVPDDYATIQAAIDAALPGDVIVVADGVYTGTGNRKLDFLGKAITLRSASLIPDVCVIDCEQTERGVSFHSNEGPDSVLAGITIRNASNNGAGGAVKCLNSSPTIKKCRFVDNQALMGGAVYCENSSPTLSDCVIVGNTASSGAGLYMLNCQDSSPTINKCRFIDNQAQTGGAVYCEDSSPTLSDCVMVGNTAQSGAGLYAVNPNGQSSISFKGCTIRDNHAENQGGGLFFAWVSDVEIADCLIEDNVASIAGGGVFVFSSETVNISDCQIRSNAAIGTGAAVPENGRGGGLIVSANHLEMTDCSITGNSSHGAGGGLYMIDGNAKLANCIITNNRGITGGVHAQASQLILTNCLFAYNAFVPGSAIVRRSISTLVSTGATDISNCTFAMNDPDGVAHNTISLGVGTQRMANSIMWNTTVDGEIHTGNPTTDISYSLVREGWSGSGVGMRDGNPLFADPDGPDDDPNTWEDNDFRLLPGSPCIDAGDNVAVPLDEFDLDGDGDVNEPLPVDLDGFRRFFNDLNTPDAGNGSAPIVDIGAYEFDAQIAPGCVGDVNCDGAVDALDISPFINALLNPVRYADQFPDCWLIHADIDANGRIDMLDISPFVKAILAGGSGGCP